MACQWFSKRSKYYIQYHICTFKISILFLGRLAPILYILLNVILIVILYLNNKDFEQDLGLNILMW